MGQKYEGTLIIQTNDYYSPVGSRVLAPLSNPASADDIANGKGLYDGNGVLLNGSFIDGWPLEISTEEDMDAFITLENVGRYVKYTGTASQGGGAPAPVNPIAVGDTITQLYFDTTKTPDFSLLDWSNAENVEGMEIIALVNSEGLTAGQAPLCVVKMTNSTLGGIVNEVYILQCNIESDNNLYYQCTPEDVEFLVQNGATPNQWLTTNEPFVLEKEVVVSVVNQQDIWGAYISKDGQWTSGAKYTSGQVYKVVQNGDIAELKEIQY